ncbi:hypothetical protein OROHE_003077 [Orobanche hederae]
MGSKVVAVFLGLLLATVLFISSEVVADTSKTSNEAEKISETLAKGVEYRDGGYPVSGNLKKKKCCVWLKRLCSVWC